jgi:hypothetical protein
MLMLKSSLETTISWILYWANSNRYKPSLLYGNRIIWTLTIFVYEDAKWEETLELVDSTSEYA